MIIVKCIVGESYNFDTGAQVPKALVLTNGVDEVNVPVDDEIAMEVVKLLVGDRVTDPAPQKPSPAPAPAQTFEAPNFRAVPQDPPDEYRDPESGVASI